MQSKEIGDTGIDTSNVRREIHWGVPSDVESYLQQTGRAGREGLPALATVDVT